VPGTRSCRTFVAVTTSSAGISPVGIGSQRSSPNSPAPYDRGSTAEIRLLPGYATAPIGVLPPEMIMSSQTSLSQAQGHLSNFTARVAPLFTDPGLTAGTCRRATTHQELNDLLVSVHRNRPSRAASAAPAPGRHRSINARANAQPNALCTGNKVCCAGEAAVNRKNGN
jgi:hypothetical protein